MTKGKKSGNYNDFHNIFSKNNENSPTSGEIVLGTKQTSRITQKTTTKQASKRTSQSQTSKKSIFGKNLDYGSDSENEINPSEIVKKNETSGDFISGLRLAKLGKNNSSSSPRNNHHTIVENEENRSLEEDNRSADSGEESDNDLLEIIPKNSRPLEKITQKTLPEIKKTTVSAERKNEELSISKSLEKHKIRAQSDTNYTEKLSQNLSPAKKFKRSERADRSGEVEIQALRKKNWINPVSPAHTASGKLPKFILESIFKEENEALKNNVKTILDKNISLTKEGLEKIYFTQGSIEKIVGLIVKNDISKNYKDDIWKVGDDIKSILKNGNQQAIGGGKRFIEIFDEVTKDLNPEIYEIKIENNDLALNFLPDFRNFKNLRGLDLGESLSKINYQNINVNRNISYSSNNDEFYINEGDSNSKLILREGFPGIIRLEYQKDDNAFSKIILTKRVIGHKNYEYEMPEFAAKILQLSEFKNSIFSHELSDISKITKDGDHDFIISDIISMIAKNEIIKSFDEETNSFKPTENMITLINQGEYKLSTFEGEETILEIIEREFSKLPEIQNYITTFIAPKELKILPKLRSLPNLSKIDIGNEDIIRTENLSKSFSNSDRDPGDKKSIEIYEGDKFIKNINLKFTSNLPLELPVELPVELPTDLPINSPKKSNNSIIEEPRKEPSLLEIAVEKSLKKECQNGIWTISDKTAKYLNKGDKKFNKILNEKLSEIENLNTIIANNKNLKNLPDLYFLPKIERVFLGQNYDKFVQNNKSTISRAIFTNEKDLSGKEIKFYSTNSIGEELKKGGESITKVTGNLQPLKAKKIEDKNLTSVSSYFIESEIFQNDKFHIIKNNHEMMRNRNKGLFPDHLSHEMMRNRNKGLFPDHLSCEMMSDIVKLTLKKCIRHDKKDSENLGFVINDEMAILFNNFDSTFRNGKEAVSLEKIIEKTFKDLGIDNRKISAVSAENDKLEKMPKLISLMPNVTDLYLGENYNKFANKDDAKKEDKLKNIKEVIKHNINIKMDPADNKKDRVLYHQLRIFGEKDEKIMTIDKKVSHNSKPSTSIKPQQSNRFDIERGDKKSR